MHRILTKSSAATASVVLRVSRPALCSNVIRLAPVAFSQRRYLNIRDRYKGQLEQRAKEQNTTVDGLFASLEDQQKVKPVAEPVSQKPQSSSTDATSSESKKAAKDAALEQIVRSTVSSSSTDEDAHKTKRLASYVDTEKLGLHTREEIEMIWKARFFESQTEFSGSLEPEAFSRLYANARRYPLFLLPQADGDGAALHFLQWSFTGNETINCLITLLAEYKLNGEFARPHTVFHIHSDFAADKGVILTNASLQDNQIGLDSAALLVLNLQRFYTADPNSPHGQQKLDLLRHFNEGSPEFSVESLLSAAETLD